MEKVIISGARVTSHHLGGLTRVTSHPPGAAAYFMLLLCSKFHSPVSPDPLNARLLGFPKSPF